MKGTEVKFFEVRDAGTTMPVMVTAFNAGAVLEADGDTQAHWLMRRGGWGDDQTALYFACLCPDVDRWAVALAGASTLHVTSRELERTRTLPVAWTYIAEHWFKVESGQVVDVEFILGTHARPKLSDRFFDAPEYGEEA